MSSTDSPRPLAAVPAADAARPLALVTGASSGIGRELARLFVATGHDVVVTAEDAGLDHARAELTADGAHVEAVRADLATREGVEQLVAAVERLGRPLDALALNAGVGVGGPFLETDLEAELRMIALNVTAVVHLAKRLLPPMVARGRGRVLVTSSIAAEMPGPFEAVYAATKAFDHSFAEAIRNELKDTGVTVTSLQPGPTETNFFHRAGMDDTRVGASDTKDDAGQVAQQGFDAMMAGKDHVVAGSLLNKVQATLAQVTPDALKAQVHRKLAEPGSAP
jgi:short-subunit dehydrogenase